MPAKYSVFHASDGTRRLQGFRSHELLKLWDKGELDRLLDVANRFDALEGFPWSLMYPDWRAAYPDAKFVLTCRTTPEKWLASESSTMRAAGYGMH